MAIMEDTHAEVSAPLITEVERVDVVAPSSLPEGYGLQVSTGERNGFVTVVS